MKKSILSIFALGAVFGMSAADISALETSQGQKTLKHNPDISVISKASQTTPITRADDGVNWFGYCGEYYDCIGLGANGLNSTLEGAIEIPAELASQWEGAKVTKVSIGFGTSSTMKAMVYVTEDLEGYTATQQDVTFTKEKGWNEVTLDTPYTITGETFYVGYQTITQAATDFPLGIDGIMSPNSPGSWIGIDNSFFNAGADFGRLCIRLGIEGDMPESLGVLINEYNVPEFAEVNTSFDTFFSLTNTGTIPLTGLDIQCFVGDEEVTDYKMEIWDELLDANGNVVIMDEVPFGATVNVFISNLHGSKVGNVPVDVQINKLVGTTQTVEYSQVLSDNILIASQLFPKRFVIEEFTGTWCGWCPRGIVGMEYMQKNYPDQFIGIAVHSDDVMTSPSYQQIDNIYSGGSYPSAVWDRVYYFDPSVETLQYYYNQVGNYPSPIGITLDAQYDQPKNVINASANTTFAYNDSGTKLALAFAITENNVGPYKQSNNFAGGGYGDLEGWSDKSKTVTWYYDHVARYIDAPFGIENSIPGNVTDGQPITYSTSIDVAQTGVKDINNSNVIVMIIDQQTGEIKNAAQVSLKGQAGVESLIDDASNGVYKVFSPQGVKVLETLDANEINNLPKGIYIVNGKKVLVK